ncbi:MAG: hypothetical protein FWE09_08100 [Treponema sp.]|nr:hypothetical protein [Treponema sp.]
MKTKLFFAAAILLAVVAFPALTQEEEAAVAQAGPMPKNTIAIGIRPDLLFLEFINNISLEKREILFGVASWYSRNLTENLSVGGRLGYGMLDNDLYIMQSFSADASVRHGYRNGPGIRFLEGTLGYANVFLRDHEEGREEAFLADFFRLGGKIGQRFEFGRPDGFMLEAALEGALGVRVGDSLNRYSNEPAFGFGRLADFMQNLLAWGLFIGGLHVHLSFGYVF